VVLDNSIWPHGESIMHAVPPLWPRHRWSFRFSAGKFQKSHFTSIADSDTLDIVSNMIGILNMSANRISAYGWDQSPAQTAVAAVPETFVCCPNCFATAISAPQWACYQQLCQVAYQRALASFAPSFYQRLFINWN